MARAIPRIAGANEEIGRAEVAGVVDEPLKNCCTLTLLLGRADDLEADVLAADVVAAGRVAATDRVTLSGRQSAHTWPQGNYLLLLWPLQIFVLDCDTENLGPIVLTG